MTITAILIGIILIFGLVIALLALVIKDKSKNEAHLKRTILEARAELAQAAAAAKRTKEALDEANRRKATLDAGTDGERFDASLDVLSELSRRTAAKP